MFPQHIHHWYEYNDPSKPATSKLVFDDGPDDPPSTLSWTRCIDVLSMFVLSKWQHVALPTRWCASVCALFYCYLTFLDHTTNISRKVHAPEARQRIGSAKRCSKLSLGQNKHGQFINAPKWGQFCWLTVQLLGRGSGEKEGGQCHHCRGGHSCGGRRGGHSCGGRRGGHRGRQSLGERVAAAQASRLIAILVPQSLFSSRVSSL